VVGSVVADRLPPDLAAVPVSDPPPTTLAFCWSPRSANAEILALADAFTAHARGAITPASPPKIQLIGW
jgi:hypothetical protein